MTSHPVPSGPDPDVAPGQTDTVLLEGLQGSRAGLGELVRFLKPFLKPQARSITLAFIFGIIALSAAAVIPLVIDGILTHDLSDHRPFVLLVVLVVIDIATSWLSRRQSFQTAAEVARNLSEFVYQRTVKSSMLRQVGLRRPSVISRHTSDVDRIEEAIDVTMAEGIPGVVQIVVSLVLLCYVERRVGLLMIVVTVAFVLVYSRIGRTMLMIDKNRLDASSDVGALVDESITASRAFTGLNLFDWMAGRFSDRALRLHYATTRQKRQVSRLYVTARAAGHVALLGIALLAIVGGAAEAGAIAASLLYIDAVVRGMEALPPWLRDVRLAVTSKRRIEQITRAPALVNRDQALTVSATRSGLVLTDLMTDAPASDSSDIHIGESHVVAIVSDLGASASHLLEELSGEANPEQGSVLLDGVDVRHPMVRRRIMLVVNEHDLMDASVAEHLRAVRPTLGADDQDRVLDLVGLAYLRELPGGGIHSRLGTHAQRLSVHERQRLMIAMAIVGDADVVAIEELPALSDPDTAGPLIDGLLERPGRQVLIQTTSSDVAARSDAVLAQIGTHMRFGPHAELMSDPQYAAIWERQISGGVDARILEMIDPASRDAVRSRLMTEQFRAGDTLFRAGSPADRLLYVVTGRVAVIATDEDGYERRLAEIGPGNFCGDVSRPGARHSETVRAIDDTMVRTLSVEAWGAGLLGLLEADPTERRIISAVLRSDSPTAQSVQAALIDIPAQDVLTTLRTLIERGQIRQDQSEHLSVATRRRSLAGSSALLDRLTFDDELPHA